MNTDQKEGKYDAANEQPLANIEIDGDTTFDIFAVIEDLIGPFCG
jgi:hypothetical protein